MLRTLIAVFALAPLAVLGAACGDGPDPVPTPTSTPTAIPTAAATQTMPPPTVPEGNIEAIYPEHGARVTQASTRTGSQDGAGGACVQASFDGPAENAQWIRVVFDDEEVTPELTVIFPVDAETTSPEGATFCWAPEDGFTVGVHTVAVGVQNPSNPQEPPQQILQWQFEVTP